MSYSNDIGGLRGALSSIVTTGATQRNTATTTQSKDAAASQEQTDQATLSPTGGLVAQALAGSDVRMDKVTQLQKAIAGGSYNVSSADVAGKMIDSLLK